MNIPFLGFPKIITLTQDKFPDGFFANTNLQINLNSGLTTLLGPNGSGKTKTLKVLRDELKIIYGNEIVRFVSAGRMGVLESFRSNSQGNHEPDPNEAYLGNQALTRVRKQSETVVGDFIALDTRSDLKLKVESRLQGLFKKTTRLTWGQSGLKVDFKSIQHGSEFYGIGSEASGLTQLVAMLAAIYDDEIKFLLLDEPEVSMHPQLQAFILKEVLSVAGDPDVTGKKCVIFSTHSPILLQLKKTSHLPSIIFFNNPTTLPKQVTPTDTLLTEPSIRGLILRLSEYYKIGFFAQSVLLSEGLSDEIVVNAIADIKNANFSSTGVQVVPVNGKTELKMSDQLFNMIGKKTCMLGDLDVLDDDLLINYVDSHSVGNQPLLSGQYLNCKTLYDDLTGQLGSLILNNWQDVSAVLVGEGYWPQSGQPNPRAMKRCILSYVARHSIAQISNLANSADWLSLKQKIDLLLNQLDENKLVLIRAGSLEDCNLNIAIPSGVKKPERALLEAEYLIDNTPTAIDTAYASILTAINNIKLPQNVIEEEMLREKLGSVLGAIDANFSTETTDDEIQNRIENIDNNFSSVFKIAKKSHANGDNYIEIEIISSLFQSYISPIQHVPGSSLNELKNKLIKR